jgi:hypothetical protein
MAQTDLVCSKCVERRTVNNIMMKVNSKVMVTTVPPDQPLAYTRRPIFVSASLQIIKLCSHVVQIIKLCSLVSHCACKRLDLLSFSSCLFTFIIFSSFGIFPYFILAPVYSLLLFLLISFVSHVYCLVFRLLSVYFFISISLRCISVIFHLPSTFYVWTQLLLCHLCKYVSPRSMLDTLNFPCNKLHPLAEGSNM